MLLPLLTLLTAQPQAAIQIPLDSGWALSGQGSQIGDHQGVRAIRLRTGAAIRRDVSLEDGTIDFDLYLAPLRAFAYLRFRMATDQEYEEIYLRTHKTNLPDALQYSPVWNGESNWQLYHGPGYTAAAPLPTGRWFRARLVVRGRQAALFLGDTLRPRMIMPLGQSSRAGPISFRSFVPGPPDGEPAAAYANVVVRPGYVPWRFEPDSVRTPPPGLIRRWQISPAVAVEPGLVTAVPAVLQQGQAAWPVLEVEPTGVLVIGRHIKRPAASAAVVARLVLQSRSPVLQRLNLGFSDYVTVLVNGEPVFGGDAHYSFDQPRQEGLIGLSQAAVWLPLRAGSNEILFLLSDGFGGFGIMGQLEPTDGVTVTTP